MVWKDGRGTTRFNSVVIRDVSETGAYIENVSGSAIPLFRLVSLQVERSEQAETVPTTLRNGRVLSAVYRVGPSRQSTGVPRVRGSQLCPSSPLGIAAPQASSTVGMMSRFCTSLSTLAPFRTSGLLGQW